jgi:Bifunctional DNA primase/polymerase, N-terminal/AAA domain/Primase C terminal 1 (PriCT-1)
MDNTSSPTTSSTGASEAMPDCLRFALFYASRNFFVLPLHAVCVDRSCSCENPKCTSIGKHPLTPNGVKDATRSPERIREWWRRYPFANVGIATGRGLLVIDIDPRHGGSLEAFKASIALPKTATVQTGGGGWHLYFAYTRSQYEVRNSVGKLADGIDIRGEGGYVVAPPSNHLEGTYHWTERCLPTRASELLLTRLGARPPSAAPAAVQKKLATQMELTAALPPVQPRSAAPSSDQSAAPAQAIPEQPTVPEKSAAPAQASGIPEGKRNSTLLRWSGSLRHWGASEEAIAQVLLIMNQACCQPPIGEEEVRAIAKSASSYEPAGQQEMLALPDPGTRTTGLYDIKSVSMIMNEDLPEPSWAIPGFLPEGVTLLAGKPKMGKSWLALALAIDIALGKPALGGLSTTKGEVLYLGLEDSQRRIKDRVLKLLGGTEAPVELNWCGYWPALQPDGLYDLEVWLQRTPTARMIVIDTLARVRSPGPTGGSVYAEDYAVITPLKRLAETYHVSILLVHHLRKNAADDLMDTISGSTGLTGATDCNMVLERERGEKTALLHITGRDVEMSKTDLVSSAGRGLYALKNTQNDTE